MTKLLPVNQILGFVFSLVLTGVALLVYYLDMSFTTGITILVVTAFSQALLQFLVFMHVGETKDKYAIYTKIAFMVFIGVFVILGSMFLFLWDM